MNKTSLVALPMWMKAVSQSPTLQEEKENQSSPGKSKLMDYPFPNGQPALCRNTEEQDEVNSVDCTHKHTHFIPSDPLVITTICDPKPGNAKPSLGFHGHYMYVMYTYISRQNIHTQKMKINLFKSGSHM